MIKMTYAQVSNGSFQQACHRLASLPLQAKQAYTIKKVMDVLTQKRKQIMEEYQNMLKLYANLDEKGNPKSVEGRPELTDIPVEKKEEFEKAQEDFGNTEFTVDRQLLTFAILGDQRISAAELFALEPLFEDPEVVPAGANVTSINAASS